jgi:chaperonin GroEL (HSP60 family)
MERALTGVIMTSKHVLFQSQARDKLLRGTTALADAVRVTLGPKSRSVLIDKSWGTPLVCNDGVTIAKEFELADPEENLGAKVLKQAAVRTGEQVGAPCATQVGGDTRTALRVLCRALEAPARQIARNSEADDGVVVERMRSGELGFDASNGTYVDMFATGIIDAAKVMRCALENAVSVAGTLLLSEATMTEVKEPDRASSRGLEEGIS